MIVHRRRGKNTHEKRNNRIAALNDPNIDLSKSCRITFVRNEFWNEKDVFGRKDNWTWYAIVAKFILCRRMYFEKLKPNKSEKETELEGLWNKKILYSII